MPHRPKPLASLTNGSGHSPEQENNAIAMANTPCWERLQQGHPTALSNCSGNAVGLPNGQRGDSEVDHIHIGLGRYINLAKDNSKALHILGLLPDDSAYKHGNRFATMVKIAAKRGLKKTYPHGFLGGRHMPPKSGGSSIALLCALQRIVNALQKVGGQLLLTADHGNIKYMADKKTGRPHTAHTINPMPLAYVRGGQPLAEGGGWPDLAPTMLVILGIEKPSEMSGRSLTKAA